MPLSVVKLDNELSHIALSGRMDSVEAKEIEAEFRKCTGDRGRPVLIDLSGVSFMSSLGMRIILTAVRALKPLGAKVAVLKPAPLVEEAMRAASLEQVLVIEHDLGRALAALKSG